MSEPWKTEPDRARWQTGSGLQGLIKRGPMGHLCGYVGVDKDHPLYGVGYSQESAFLTDRLAQRMNEPIGEAPSFPVLLLALGGNLKTTMDAAFRVHGGITFADKWNEKGEDGDLWWIGFDCAHAGDLTPSSLKYGHVADGDVYRDINYVRAEVESLAAQIAKVPS